MRKPLLIAILAINVLLHAASGASLRVYPRYQLTSGRGWVRVTVVIEPDEHNRSYCLVYEGTYSGQTCRELPGKAAARTQPLIELKDLPEGHYDAQVKVGRNDGNVISSAVVGWDIYGPNYSGPENP